MRLRTLVSLMTLPLLALAACGSVASSSPGTTAQSSQGSSAASSPTAPSSASSSAASSSAAPLGPAVPAETTVARAVPRDRMPTASGAFGDKPTISVPSTPPPASLQRVVLSKGDGPTSVAGDWLEVNYLGQVWGGKVFDNSYDRAASFTVQIGGPQQMVVPGWDVGLRGVAQGSRVLLSFPPEDGYGPKGNPPDISGSDTLIFVVDVLKVISGTDAGQTDAAVQSTPGGLPAVQGAPGSQPTVSVPTSLAAPTKNSVVVLAKGTGAPAQVGDVLVQYVVTSWDGTKSEKSWPDPAGQDATAGTGPQSLPLAENSPFQPLIGVPLGSRVLLTMAADSTNGTPALAWVIDLIAQRDVTPTGTAGASATGEPPTEPSG